MNLCYLPEVAWYKLLLMIFTSKSNLKALSECFKCSYFAWVVVSAHAFQMQRKA